MRFAATETAAALTALATTTTAATLATTTAAKATAAATATAALNAFFFGRAYTAQDRDLNLHHLFDVAQQADIHPGHKRNRIAISTSPRTR